MIFRLLLILTTASLVHGYKILALFPHRGKSHFLVYYPLVEALAKKGHDVTVMGHYPLKTPIPNYRDVVLHEEIPTIPGNLGDFTGSWLQRWFTLLMLDKLAEASCTQAFASSVVKDFLKTDERFDVIITQAFNSECFASFANKFKAPTIGISTCIIPHWISERVGTPTTPSYIPNVHMEHYDRMPFLARVENLVLGVLQQLYYNSVMMKYGEDIAKEYFGEDSPSLMDITLNTSLLLVNSHFSLTLPRPTVPALVEVGGMHIGQVKKLPTDLEKWINESTHGVIYFSLGSMIKGHTFPDEKRQEFLKAFGRLPQRVLWKYENDTMPGKPDNVMIQKWMPQLDILCHPNVKAFISHGGLLGTTEAVHCGVPVMVMPQYGDQFTNAKALEANGGGVILHLYEATEEKVYDALKTILDPKFKKQAEELSTRFRDRPMPPLETAIYWVEYVARHRGAHHMRTAAVGMPLYKYLLLDVIAFLLLVFGLVFAASFYVTRAIFRKLFGKKDKQKGD
ncbi:hypothetical protein Zmor_010047 [Zophobas morio]|uniref:UDP-glucuronosyltransferase n=2 Tax=Zophobas morio TaxID=2755281 RepID=A0AA38MJB2_9CUCU|nr:hypothetical protein Zmor_010047 [Zophobas morio]